MWRRHTGLLRSTVHHRPPTCPWPEKGIIYYERSPDIIESGRVIFSLIWLFLISAQLNHPSLLRLLVKQQHSWLTLQPTRSGHARLTTIHRALFMRSANDNFGFDHRMLILLRYTVTLTQTRIQRALSRYIGNLRRLVDTGNQYGGEGMESRSRRVLQWT